MENDASRRDSVNHNSSSHSSSSLDSSSRDASRLDSSGEDKSTSSDARAERRTVEREIVEYRLQERERFLRTLISNLPGIVYRCRTNEDWTPEFMNDAVDLLGYAAKDFTQTRRISWDAVMHAEDRERVRGEVRRLMETCIPFSTTSYLVAYRVFTASGNLKHIRDRFRFVYDAQGKVIALEGVITDITELTLADERIRESENRYRLLAENMNDLVCLHDPDGTFLYLSPSCERILGFHADQLAGTNPYDLFHPEDAPRIREEAHKPLLAGQATEVMTEYRMRRKSGAYVWLETMSQRVTSAQGELVRLITCSRDISKRKASEEERNRAEAERAALLISEQNARLEAERAREEALHASQVKDEFLQMVSHEFRTPLTTIKTAARVLLGDGESPEERRQYLETISTECDRQIDMIINLLDISRLEAKSGGVDLKHERVNISDVLCSCERIERPAAQARRQDFIVIHANESAHIVRGDSKALRRALCTIIENAIKYTPEGGRIEVATQAVSTTDIAITITDNGRGIRAEDLPHIFDKFFRGANPNAFDDPTIDGTPDDAVKPETPGVGLGLYLAERLICALEGRIEVASAPGSGSRFTVFLPLWNDALHSHDEHDEYGFEEAT